MMDEWAVLQHLTGVINKKLPLPLT